MKSILRTVLSVLRMALGVACIVVIALCVAMIVEKLIGRARADLTEHRMYTLSEGTRNIIGKLNQPVTLKLYYSRVAARKGPEFLREYNNYYLYVRDLLEEYADLSNGNLKLEVVDPRPFTDEEEEAIHEHELKHYRISEDEKFFFGLVARNELGKKKVIPMFQRERQELVEYDISKLINSVTRTKKRRLGILSTLPVMGIKMTPAVMRMLQMQRQMPPPPWIIAEHLREGYEVERVE